MLRLSGHKFNLTLKKEFVDVITKDGMFSRGSFETFQARFETHRKFWFLQLSYLIHVLIKMELIGKYPMQIRFNKNTIIKFCVKQVISGLNFNKCVFFFF